MTAYAVGHLRPGKPHEEVFTYMDRIQDTMDPFGGRFLVHGAAVEAVEGQWPGTIVLIGFPDMDRARAWYRSSAYQEILPLRTRHLEGEVILVDGVGAGYDVTRTAARLREEARRTGALPA
ncbi:DUF1330 domain-containing protein [Actinacidiphila sp. bgisy160]|uniref:DUF1330 domain-containing protein n=1 Tax=Actinacidiphila sp. bgisy160 TaxID=3413796 RepID=UPI003D72A4A9